MRRKSKYLVKYEDSSGVHVIEVEAEHYADAVSQFPNWIAVIKKSKDIFE